MRVTVRRPRVVGDRVLYSWRLSEATDLQHRTRFRVRFHGLPLRGFHRAVLWDVLLTLQLPVWARMGKEVVVELPEPVPTVVVDWWRAFHDADNVRFVGPLTDERSYTPLSTGIRVPEPVDVAVSFGGGKDSLLALNALLERREPDRVLLLHVVQHFSARPLMQLKVARRSRGIVAPVARRSGVRTQLVTTDFIPTLTNRGRAARPHINLYTAATLPALLYHGAKAVTVSRNAIGYRTRRARDGTVRWSNPSGRPERLEALAQYYDRVLGVTLEPEGTHYAIGEFVSFRALLRLYPDAFADMTMCMRTTARHRWCHECAKCLEFAVFGLAVGAVADDMDYDRLFSSSIVSRLVASAESLADTTAWHGNAPFVREIGTPSHFASFCHALHLADLDLAARVMSAESLRRVQLLQRAWGRRPFPAVAAVDEQALAAAGPLGREVAERASTVCGTWTSPSATLPVADKKAAFSHGGAMELPLIRAWQAKWLSAPDRRMSQN